MKIFNSQNLGESTLKTSIKTKQKVIVVQYEHDMFSALAFLSSHENRTSTSREPR